MPVVAAMMVPINVTDIARPRNMMAMPPSTNATGKPQNSDAARTKNRIRDR